MIHLQKPDIRLWARKHKKQITNLVQIAFLLFLAMIVASLFIGTTSSAEAEMGKWTNPAPKARVEAPVASQTPSKAMVDPKTGTKIVPKVAVGDKSAMKDLIRRISAELGYKRPEWAIAIATCESGLRPEAIGDHGKSWGMWQIHQPSHPTVGKKAFDAEWSTRWSIEQLLHGRDSMWTCARILSK